jgi:excisionase family DNA binding protein
VNGEPNLFQGKANREGRLMRSTFSTESPQLYKAKEVAFELRRDVRTIYRWLKNGKLEGRLLAGSTWRIPKEAVRLMLDHQTSSCVKHHPRLCPHCNTSEQQIKAGHNRTGTQRFLCQACGRSYTPSPALHGYPDEVRKQALNLYQNGSSLRSIGRHFAINHQTVANWIKTSNARRTAKRTV